MKNRFLGILLSVAVLCSFILMCDVAWALKNVCPSCNVMIKNLELTACPNCGKIINKCLTCNFVNPIKNDNCENCSASLAESRVSRTIDKETREDLSLGESPRAKIDVELGQIDEKSKEAGLTQELAARQVVLYTEMGWWSKVNKTASEFSSRFPQADQRPQVVACQIKALENLAFLAQEAKDKNAATEYLNTLQSLNPNYKESQDRLKMANEPKQKVAPKKKSKKVKHSKGAKK